MKRNKIILALSLCLAMGAGALLNTGFLAQGMDRGETTAVAPVI